MGACYGKFSIRAAHLSKGSSSSTTTTTAGANKSSDFGQKTIDSNLSSLPNIDDYEIGLKTSVRFQYVDLCVKVFPEPVAVKIGFVQVKSDGDDDWQDCPFEIYIPKFSMMATVELKPSTTYKIRVILNVKLAVRNSELTQVKTPEVIVTTNKMSVPVPAYEASSNFEKRQPNEVSFSKGDILIETDK